MSRLLNNSDQTRNFLETRNLYTPEDPYDANASNTVDTINSISNLIAPFSSFDLTNTVVGRLVGNNTPLAQIGLEMLGRQFGATAASNATAEYLPAIKFENLFDGDPDTKFLSVKKDFQITRREVQGNVGRILEEISGNYPKKGNPFTNTTTNIDIIKNSGKGQLQLLVKSLNANKYKPSTQLLSTTLNSEGFNYGDNTTVYNIFPDNDNIFYPFNQYKLSKKVNINSINDNYSFELHRFRKLIESSDGYLEYGSSQRFVDGLGKTEIKDNNDGSGNYKFENYSEANYGLENDVTQKLIWGRDGVDNNYKDERTDNIFDGVQPSENGETINKNPRFDFVDNEDVFNMEAGGLLSYTRDLLKTKGKYSMFDLTKKKFLDTNEQLHFNGSPLTTRLNGDIDKNRQHNVADPYNTYVKAIRFNGNKIYNGNQNSVIYNSVLPQITPNTINKNLMFSIENLAVKVTGDDDDNFATMDDGTTLPSCEKGFNEGRLMWFPPYDIQLSENVVVNRETTNFIGRGEPIYTYNSTERMANLSFKLIIDYPPNIKGLDHVNASRFFAFGGDAEPSTSNVGDKEKKRDDLIKERDSITPKKKVEEPSFNLGSTNFFFANDQPKIGAEAGTVDYHLNVLGYEIEKESDTEEPDGRNFGYNEDFLNNIDRLINELLVDDQNRPYIQIFLRGSASTLFLGDKGSEYNELLSKRRISGIRTYIENKYKEITGRDINQDGVKFLDSGSDSILGGVGGTATDDVDEISTSDAKQARKVFIDFQRTDFQKEIDVELSDKEKQDKENLDGDITALDSEISKQKLGRFQNGCDFTPYSIKDGIVIGFEPSQNNKYKPAFHSQTPEDFHRRLTFLQQCTRQGQAVRKLRENNTFSANNAVFGRQPVQILRIGDFFNSKIFIDNLQIDYSDSPWDMNPEGMGMQFMIADVKMQLKLVGGQSLKGPINALQNALSFNYYANSTFYNDGVYSKATKMETLQYPDNPATKTVDTEKVEDIPNTADFVALKTNII